MKHNSLSTVLSFHKLVFILLLSVPGLAYSQSPSLNPVNGTTPSDIHSTGIGLVEIISFTTNINKDKVSINWFVASENNLNHYVIQRSYDDRLYEDIGIVHGVGPDRKINYKYVDTIKGKNNGTLFYRLKAVDNMEKTKYSSVSIVRMIDNKISSIVAFPNPFHNEVFVTMPSKWQNTAVRIQVFNNSGQKISEQYFNASGQTATLALSHLVRGTYIIRAFSANESYQQMIIKD